MLPVQLNQAALPEQADPAVSHGHIPEQSLPGDSRRQGGSAGAQLLRAQQGIHRLVGPGGEGQQRVRLPVFQEALKHGRGRGLAHPVPVGQTAHAVGHQSQQPLGAVELRG